MLLSQKRTAILEKWWQLILEAYPADTAAFLKQGKDRFVNPVGFGISQGIVGLYEALLRGTDSAKLLSCLDNIIRITAVQDFTPAQSVAFVYLLKKAIRAELANEIREDKTGAELWQLESRIEELALLAFDTYAKCREKIYEIRINEVKAEREQVLRLLARTNQMLEGSGSKAAAEKI